METLADFLPAIRALGTREALRTTSGYRTHTLTYRDLLGTIGACVGMLDERAIGKGDRLILWGENRLAWVAAFWACVFRGVEVVPLDYRSSARFVARIQAEVGARVALVGDEVDAAELSASGIEVERMALADVETLEPWYVFESIDLSPDDVVEIVYTSGTTGEPKGVVHRHRNLCANLSPIGREIDKYRRYARPVQPIRMLDLLPLSHLFGQATGVFIPVLLGGAVVFTTDVSPGALIETIRRNRVSVLIGVPRMVASLERELGRRFDLEGRRACRSGWPGVPQRWWRYRDVHRALGWKFWCLVVGGAPLEPEREAFWRRLGYVVVQGYGLTETSPVVTLNHPFHPRPGSIGKVIEGLDVRIAPDGEILVRGPSVTQEGWLHTGDIGEIDAEGNLYYRGRKKEMIVTSAGLNVYPHDVEAALDRSPGIRESAVVGVEEGGEERVHAVVLLDDPDVDVAAAVREANEALEPHQRIQAWSVWPEEEFPRTESTWKVKRGEVAAWVAAEKGEVPEEMARAPRGRTPRDAIAELARRDAGEIGEDLRLGDDLGLSSLDQVELLSRLESELGVELDESAFAGETTVGELERWAREASAAPRDTAGGPGGGAATAPAAGAGTLPARFARPRWSRWAPVRLAREILLDVVAVPLFRSRLPLRVEGLEHVKGLDPPVLFAANHASHLDTVAVCAALPPSWRRRLAPAMMQEYFAAGFDPGKPLDARFESQALFLLAAASFNAYPLPHRMSGTRRALRYTGELVDAGYCPLVYPEGERTKDGAMAPFKPGIGLMAVRLQVPVVPIAIEGTFEIYSIHDHWPRRGNVVVRFGAPLRFEPGTPYDDAARQVEAAVRAMAPGE